jgi:hypothetical protein
MTDMLPALTHCTGSGCGFGGDGGSGNNRRWHTGPNDDDNSNNDGQPGAGKALQSGLSVLTAIAGQMAITAAANAGDKAPARKKKKGEQAELTIDSVTDALWNVAGPVSACASSECTKGRAAEHKEFYNQQCHGQHVSLCFIL